MLYVHFYQEISAFTANNNIDNGEYFIIYQLNVNTFHKKEYPKTPFI